MTRHSTRNPFQVHGLWAPGVLLMRHINFKWKAVLISLSFLLPMGALLLYQMHLLTVDALQARQDALREHVDLALGITAWAQEQESRGTMRPGLEAQQWAAR